MRKRHRSRDSSDPIAEYQEWAENRYNPGYWTGGQVPPNVKNLWSTKDRHWLGIVFVVGGIASFASVIYWEPAEDAIVALGAWGVGLVTVGLVLLLSKDQPRKKRR